MLRRFQLYLAVAAVSLTWESSARRYLGCYQDSEQRLFPSYNEIGPTMTIKICQDTCQNKGFRFASPEHHTQCFCGDNYPPYRRITLETKCNVPCRGNLSQMCGGTWFGSVFDLHEDEGINDIIPFAGCFEALPSPREIATLLRPIDCVKGCAFDRFKYAGMRGTSCICSNEAPALIQDKGSSPKTCGNKTAVYFAREDLNQRYMGCYKMVDGVWPKGELGYTTDQTCAELCRKKGIRYAVSVDNYKCHCLNDRPSYKLMAPDAKCLNVCDTSVFEICAEPGYARVSDLAVGHSFDPQFELEGCFFENFKTGKLIDGYEVFLMENTPEKCVGLCHHYGFNFAGVKNGNVCRCGEELNKGELSSSCRTLCPGNNRETCGGKESIAIYKTECKKPENPEPVKGEMPCECQLV